MATMGWPPAPATCYICGGATPPLTTRSARPRRGPPQQQHAAVVATLPVCASDHPDRLLDSKTTKTGDKSVIKTTSRRTTILLLFPFSLSPLPLSSSAVETPTRDDDQLERYTDRAEGFTLLRPSTWIKVEKAGATALFEEQGKGSNNIGVVVNPVRLSSLEDFGTPQFVADKLIQAEMRKESTKDAEVIAATKRVGHGGLPVYEVEYTVDSTRGGMKRIFSAAFVASKKLYLLNIAYSDRPENPLDSQTRMVLEEILHSFDTTS